jgi:hypothetical protein
MPHKMLMGLSGASYFQGVYPFLNWWKSGDEISVASSTHGNVKNTVTNIGYGFLDANGDLLNPVPAAVTSISRIFYAGSSVAMRTLGNKFDGEQFIAKWDGTATGSIDFLTTGNTVNTSVPGQITFTMGTSPGNTQLTLTPTNPNDPPRNIRIYQTRYATNMANGEIFSPDYVNLLKPFPVLRFMDFMRTNFSNVSPVNFSDIATEAYYQWGGVDGPKRGFPMSIVAKLAIATGATRVHVNIPEIANDACVTAMATALKTALNGTGIVAQYEYENEPWNQGFSALGYNITQGNALFGSDPDGSNFYGYRASQIMFIIRGVYSNRALWRGVLGTQTVTPSYTTGCFAGFDRWKAATSSSLSTFDLFDAVVVAGYFGDAVTTAPTSGATNANPAVISAPYHPYQTGDVIKFFSDQAGWSALNNTYQTVGAVVAGGSGTYALAGVNSTGFASYVYSYGNYSTKAKIWQLMDQSAALNSSSPGTYPTIYTYFNQQVTQSILTGTCPFGYSTSDNGTIPGLATIYFPAQMALATGRGLELNMYEAGNNIVGTAALIANGGVAQLNDYVIQYGYSAENAPLFSATSTAFFKVGGKYPAKFTDVGMPSYYGTWPAVRFFKTTANGNTDDTGNPVWQATLGFNNNKIPDTYTLRFGA